MCLPNTLAGVVASPRALTRRHLSRFHCLRAGNTLMDGCCHRDSTRSMLTSLPVPTVKPPLIECAALWTLGHPSEMYAFIAEEAPRRRITRHLGAFFAGRG